MDDRNNQKIEEWESERLRSAKARSNRRRFQVFTVGALLFAWVLLILCIILIILKRVEDHRQAAQEAAAITEEITYSQDEVDRLVAEAYEQGEKQAQEDVDQVRQELLASIRGSLEGGIGIIETLRPYYPDRILLLSGGKYCFVPISDILKHHNYLEENLQVLENGEFTYSENGEVISHKGIDVSTFQGKIDWEKVADDGVEFVIVRTIFRGYGSGKLVEDDTFEQNIEGALRAGLKVGVYVFTQAITEEEVLEEAKLVLEKIAPYKITCPVVFDVEKIGNADGRMNNITVAERTHLTKLFCDTIEEAGYHAMIYHNMEMGVVLLNLEELQEYDKWFAYYNNNFYYPYDFKVWQYSEKGKVDGISTEVDLNISFGPIWE